MSLITIIESKDTSLDLKRTFSRLKDSQSVSAEFHQNSWLFGLIKGKPHIDLWIHDYLTDDASYDDTNLKLKPQGNELLLRFLSDFIQEHQKPFVFWSMWAGMEIGASNIEINSTHFLEYVGKNQLSINNKYIVKY